MENSIVTCQVLFQSWSLVENIRQSADCMNVFNVWCNLTIVRSGERKEGRMKTLEEWRVWLHVAWRHEVQRRSRFRVRQVLLSGLSQHRQTVDDSDAEVRELIDSRQTSRKRLQMAINISSLSATGQRPSPELLHETFGRLLTTGYWLNWRLVSRVERGAAATAAAVCLWNSPQWAVPEKLLTVVLSSLNGCHKLCSFLHSNEINLLRIYSRLSFTCIPTVYI